MPGRDLRYGLILSGDARGAVSATKMAATATGNLGRRTRQYRKDAREATAASRAKAQALGGLRKAVGALGLAFGAAALVQGLRTQLAEIDELGKRATTLGTTTVALSEMAHAAELNGVNFTSLAVGAQRMTRRVAEAAQGSGTAKDALQELGVEAETLNALPLDQKMAVLADAFAGVENQSDRVRLGFKLFDTEGVRLINLLGQGSGALNDMREEARLLGLTVEDDFARQVEATNDSLTRLAGVGTGLGRVLTAALAPAIESVANSITGWIIDAGGVEAILANLQTGFEVAGTAALVFGTVLAARLAANATQAVVSMTRTATSAGILTTTLRAGATAARTFWTAIGGPIGLIVTLAGLALAFKDELIALGETFGVWDALAAVLRAPIDLFTLITSKLAGFIRTIGEVADKVPGLDSVATALQNTADRLDGAAVSAGDFADTVGGAVGDLGRMEEAQDDLTEAVDDTASSLTDDFTPALDDGLGATEKQADAAQALIDKFDPLGAALRENAADQEELARLAGLTDDELAELGLTSDQVAAAQARAEEKAGELGMTLSEEAQAAQGLIDKFLPLDKTTRDLAQEQAELERLAGLTDAQLAELGLTSDVVARAQDEAREKADELGEALSEEAQAAQGLIDKFVPLDKQIRENQESQAELERLAGLTDAQLAALGITSEQLEAAQAAAALEGEKLASTLSDEAKEAQELVDKFRPLEAATEAYNADVEELERLSGLTEEELAALGLTLDEVRDALEKATDDRYRTAFDRLKESVGGLRANLAGAAAALADLDFDGLGDLGPALSDAFGELANILADPEITNFGDGLRTFLESGAATNLAQELGVSLGEAAFGKRAQSTHGRALGTVIGTAIAGPLGGTIGGFIGGLADALFGGDTAGQRVNAGVLIGAPGQNPRVGRSTRLGDAVTFASGLEARTFTRRASDEDSERFLRRLQGIDQALFDAATGSGVSGDVVSRLVLGNAGRNARIGFSADSSPGGALRPGGHFLGSLGFTEEGLHLTAQESADIFAREWLRRVTAQTEGGFARFRDGDGGTFRALSDRVIGLVEGLAQDTAEAIVRGFRAAVEVDRLLNADVFGDTAGAAEALGRAQRTLRDEYLAQSRDVRTLAGGLDGSANAIEELAEALTSQRQAALDLAQAYDTVGQAIASSIGQARREIEESILPAGEIIRRRADERTSTRFQLRRAVDVEEIERLAQRATELTREIFRLEGGAEGGQDVVDAALRQLEAIEREANERIEAGRQAAVEEEARLRDAIDAQALAATTNATAAQSQSAAAAKQLSASERQEAVAGRMEGVAASFEDVATRNEDVAGRMEGVATDFEAVDFPNPNEDVNA